MREMKGSGFVLGANDVGNVDPSRAFEFEMILVLLSPVER